jgi:hypothetical protein
MWQPGQLYSPDILGVRMGIEPNAWTEHLTPLALGEIAYLIVDSLLLGITAGPILAFMGRRVRHACRWRGALSCWWWAPRGAVTSPPSFPP